VFLACLFIILAIAYCYYHSPSFIILGIVWVHFFLFTKLKSFLNQNNAPIEILNRDVRIWERLLGSCLKCRMFFQDLGLATTIVISKLIFFWETSQVFIIKSIKKCMDVECGLMFKNISRHVISFI
jgi:hypothetical protein